MPRRKKGQSTREVQVDPRFNSSIVQQLINTVMERGKKTVARRIVYDAFDIIAKKTNSDEKKALEFFNKALEQIVPVVEVRPRRVGGSVYQIPTEVAPRRARSLGMRWLLKSASSRSGKTMGDRIAGELFDAFENRGGAVKKRSDVQRMAEANRAFSHYAW